VVGSIDRLARNFRKEQLSFSGGSDAVQTLMLQMMGAFAQFERSMIRERQREGIAAAKAAGKHMAKPSVDLKCMWFPVITKT